MDFRSQNSYQQPLIWFQKFRPLKLVFVLASVTAAATGPEATVAVAPAPAAVVGSWQRATAMSSSDREVIGPAARCTHADTREGVRQWRERESSSWRAVEKYWEVHNTRWYSKIFAALDTITTSLSTNLFSSRFASRALFLKNAHDDRV